LSSAPAIVWIVEPDLDSMRRVPTHVPQVLDVINPGDWTKEADQKGFPVFRHFILNTAESREYLGPNIRSDATFQVIPHHHCNHTNYLLPESRVEKPTVVGYVGQQVHLHDEEAISTAVRRAGFEFRTFSDTELSGYREIDVGIAWTRRDAQRDATRSNIKLSNFAAHGIPSVVCDYASYRAVNAICERPVARIAGSLPEFLAHLNDLLVSETSRRQLQYARETVRSAHSLTSIAHHYQTFLAQIRP
jgi:hypothetical protein